MNGKPQLNNTFTSVEDLRQVIPNYPAVLDKRIKDKMDDHCREFISHSRVAVLAIPNNAVQPFHFIDTQNQNLFVLDSDVRISMGLNMTGPSQQASLYFLIPGVNHGLRINGMILQIQPGIASLHIEQVYFHCGRAAMRGELWNPQPVKAVDSSNAKLMLANEFLEKASYFQLATVNKEGKTQLSPRGDIPGSVQLISDGHSIFLPERPGNKVAVSLRNIIENPTIALCCFIPGLAQVLTISGTAIVCDDPDMLSNCIIEKHKPKVGTLISIDQMNVTHMKSLQDINLWNPEYRVEESEIMAFSKVLNEHMMGKGIKGKVSHIAIKTIIEKDKRNLY